MGEARNVLERMVNLFDDGQLEASLDCFAPDATFTNPLGRFTGREEIAGLFEMFASAFSEVSHNVQNALTSDGVQATEGRVTATHTGTLSTPAGDVPATGRSLDLPQAIWASVRDDRIVDLRAYWDLATFMAQLGLAPEPAA
jgi:steroid delta-isomerase-like uncharacterized protein